MSLVTAAQNFGIFMFECEVARQYSDRMMQQRSFIDHLQHSRDICMTEMVRKPLSGEKEADRAESQGHISLAQQVSST